MVANDENSFDTISFELSDIDNCAEDVKAELIKLQEIGVIATATYLKPEFKVIVFEECL